MSLFNRKSVVRNLNVTSIPKKHSEILSSWAELINSKDIYFHKETSLRGQFESKIVEQVLGYTGPVGHPEYTMSTEQTILQGSVDLALGHFGGANPEILAPFEIKGAKTRDLDAIIPGRNKSPVQQAWEYAMNAPKVKWVLVTNYIELRLYGFGEGTSAYEKFYLNQLTNTEEYARFMLLLSAENLMSGRTLELLKESQREDKDITGKLYRDYKDLRLKLLIAIQDADKSIAPINAIAHAQKILDRILFIAFAEDTGLLPNNTLRDAFSHIDPYNPRPVWENFKGLFRAIDKGRDAVRDSKGNLLVSSIPSYNGGLFRTDQVIDNLTLSDLICESFKKLGDYDFASEVSVTVLGHIFEQSIADVERLQAVARGEEEDTKETNATSGRRKRDGVVYTPDYIARFIVEETLGAHLKSTFDTILCSHARRGTDISIYEEIQWRRKSAELEAWKAYSDSIKKLRILDPACGSGVFLIMAFEVLKAELSRVNDKIASLAGKDQHLDDLLNPDSEILANNLFGVDVNAESVELTKLSLWIKTARRGKALDSLSENIRVGDSLIEDNNYAYLQHAFTWKTAFPKVFSEGGFDLVIGNPPYVRQELFSNLKPYLKGRFESYHGMADLFCYFYERGIRLLKPGGRLGYISSNTFFKTAFGEPTREYFLNNATIEAVIDFGDIQIFQGVTTYPAIIILKKGSPPLNHNLYFWNLSKPPENNFYSSWKVAKEKYRQSALGVNAWELENSALRSLREKIKAGRQTLKEVYGSPFRGIVTGLNSAFVIDTQTKERLCIEDPKSAKLLKPFLEGKDLKRWRAEPRGLWLIFTRRGTNISSYPAIKSHLENMRPSLEPKPKHWKPSKPKEKWKGRKAGNYKWFEIQDTIDYHQHFAKDKISYPHFNSTRNFSFEQHGAFSNDKSYLIPSSDLALLALLNSRVLWFLLSSVSPPVRGGYHELRVQYVENMPIPHWNKSQKEKLRKLAQNATKMASQKLELQSALRRRIPDLALNQKTKLSIKLREWWTLPDFDSFRSEIKKTFKTDIPVSERSEWEDWINRDRVKIADLTKKIEQAEAEIDNIVYGLFDLHPSEITLLERSVK